MRLRTIWTMPAMTFAEKCRRTGEWLAWGMASTTITLAPKAVIYRIVLLEVAKATRNSANIPATPLDEVLANLEGGS